MEKKAKLTADSLDVCGAGIPDDKLSICIWDVYIQNYCNQGSDQWVCQRKNHKKVKPRQLSKNFELFEYVYTQHYILCKIYIYMESIHPKCVDILAQPVY